MRGMAFRVLPAVAMLWFAVPSGAQAWPTAVEFGGYQSVDVSEYAWPPGTNGQGPGSSIRFRTERGAYCNLHATTLVCAMADGSFPGFPPQAEGRITYYREAIGNAYFLPGSGTAHLDPAVTQTDGAVDQAGQTFDLREVRRTAKLLPANHKLEIDYTELLTQNFFLRSFVCWADEADAVGCVDQIGSRIHDEVAAISGEEIADTSPNMASLLPVGGPVEFR